MLKHLLRDAPLSKLLISMRDQRIAEEVSLNYETFATLAYQGPSSRNLLGQISFEEEHVAILRKLVFKATFKRILESAQGYSLHSVWQDVP